MLNEEFIDKVIDRLVERIEEGNEYVLKKIGDNIKRIGSVSPTNAQQLGQILKYGGDYDKILNKLSKTTELNIKDIETIFEEVAKNDYQFAEQFYNYRNMQYIPYKDNIPLQREIKALANITQGEYINFARTMAFSKVVNGKVVYTNLSKMYQDVIDKAVLSVAQGKQTFDQEMSKVIRELGNSGIRTVDYQNNYSRRLDSAVRMNLKGALRDLHNKIQEDIGKEFNSDGVEISAHTNPAPDHEFVQGHQFSNEEFYKFQNNMDAVDYLGNVYPRDFEGHDRRSISEYNCYHYTFSIILGVSKPNYTEDELKSINKANHKGFDYDGEHYTMYEGTQLQRQIETEIRKAKDLQILSKSSENKELIEYSQQRITLLTNKYRELSKASGLPTRLTRAKISGYRRVSTKN